MTALRTWTAELAVTDFGAWAPDDRAAAAELIGMVNRHRLHASDRPLLFRGRLEAGGWVWMLQFDLGGETDRLSPGEHLVHLQMPSGLSLWSAMPADMLADLLPGSETYLPPGEPTGPGPASDGPWR